MIRIKTIYLITFLIISFNRIAEAGRWTHLLPFENVNSIVYDGDSNTYWFGTGTSGVWHFDGQQFENLKPTIEDGNVVNQVTKLAIDGKKAELWVGTIKGLFRYNIISKEWTHYNQTSGLSQICIIALFIDNHGTLWYGSESQDGAEGGGVGRRDSTGWYRYTTDEYAKWDSINSVWIPDSSGKPIPGPFQTRNLVDSITQDSLDNMYFGTRGAGLCVLDTAGMWNCFFPFMNLPNSTIRSIAIDREDNKWLGTTGGLCLLDKGNNPVKCYKQASGLINETVNTIWIETFQNKDIKWVGTDGGVSMLDSTNQQWKNFTIWNSGLASNKVQDIVGDNDGNLWFALLDFKGISKLNNNWSELTTKDGLPSNFIRSIEKDQFGRLWVGTDSLGAVHILDRGIWKRLMLYDELCTQAPLGLKFLPHGTEMFVATGGCGIFRTSSNLSVIDKIRVNDPPEFPSNNVLTLVARNDTMWAGTDKGLVRLLIRSEDIKFDTTITSELPSSIVTALAFDRDRLWVGTSRGLTIFNGKTWVETSVAHLPQKIAINSIIRGLEGSMWIGTNVGIARFNYTDWEWFTTIDGLPDERISSMTVAPDGVIWCGTLNGAASYLDDRWTAYTTEDGLSDNFIFDVVSDQSNVVWFATWGGGISRYRKTGVGPNTFLVETFDVVTESDVTFRFSGYDVNTPTVNLRYQHALDDTSRWLLTSANNVNYSIDTDGPHTFYVRAIDKDNNKDLSPVIFRFYKVRLERGGAVEIVDSTRVQKYGSLWLYIPPNSIETGISISATPVDTGSISVEDEAMLFFTGIAYELTPQNLVINEKKPLTLKIFYGDKVAQEFDERILRIYQLANDSTWTPVGGFVDKDSSAITTTIKKFGTFGLFEDKQSPRSDISDTEIANVAAQPRILSPKGGGFLDKVTVSFDLSKPSEVTARVYNLSGRLVRVLCENNPMNPGRNVVNWNGRDYNDRVCTSGLYIVTIEAAGRMATKTVAVLNK